jgi:formate-dependent nitrite reductase membrane component NrfD
MDRYVADPHWGALIVAYFFLGGIAAGSFAVASLAALFGDESDRRATRVAHYIAFPLVCACGALLVVDLGRPERFWHMLIQSQTYRPMFKWWSPMSAGSWALSAFGAFSFATFAVVLVEDGWIRLGRWSSRVLALGRGWAGRLIAAGGLASAFFLGSYTGVLLTSSNQPIWADTTWIGALFLASSASTGVAAMLLLHGSRPREVDPHAIHRLEWVDGWAMGLEGLMLVAFALSLGGFAGPAFGRWPGVLIPAFVVPVGLLLPPFMRRLGASWAAPASSLLILAGGLALRAAVVGMPVPLLLARH